MNRNQQLAFLRQTLDKYIIIDKGDQILIRPHKYGNTFIYPLEFILENIEMVKYIHDNRDYFHDMLISNGFMLNVDNSDGFIYYYRDNLRVNIYFDFVNLLGIGNYFIDDLDNMTTMYEDLRKFIGIDIQYKQVIDG